MIFNNTQHFSFMHCFIVPLVIICSVGTVVELEAVDDILSERIIDKQSNYVIVIPDEKSGLTFPEGEDIRYAAEYLRSYIERVTGAKLKVVDESLTDSKKNKIYIGATHFARTSINGFDSLKPEELVIKTIGQNVVICGEICNGIDRGTLFGVYEFLERVCGVRWYFGDDPHYAEGMGSVIPKHDAVRIPNLDIRSLPHMTYRSGGVGYYAWPVELQKQWHPVLRFGGSLGHGLSNHTQITWTDLYGKTHPDYFAMSTSGRRRINFKHKHRSYVCLTNPAVLKQMIANVEEFDENKTPGLFPSYSSPTPGYVYFCSNDGMTPETICHCSECIKFLRPNRRFEAQSSELVFQFVRRYAIEIEKRWPGRRLVVLAYAHYKAVPEEVELPGNVDVTYVTPKIHYASEPAVYNSVSSDVRAWNKKLGGDRTRLTFWFNIVDPTLYTSWIPFMYPHTFQRFMDEHKDYASGCFINGLNQRLKRLGEKGHIGAIQTFPMVWLQAQLMWDPAADPDVLLQQYCNDLFGPAAEQMLTFYQLIIKRWESLHQGNVAMSDTGFIHTIRYPPLVMGQFFELLDHAYSAAPKESVYRQRVAYYRDEIYCKFLEESKDYHRWSGKVTANLCMYTPNPPKIDGVLEDCWQMAPSFTLVQRKWGKPSPRKTYIRLLHDGRFLYVACSFHKDDSTSLSDEELCIIVAREMESIRGEFALNKNKVLSAINIIRLKANGEIICSDKLSGNTLCKTGINGEVMIIEAKLPVEALNADYNWNIYPQMRVQFVRYWGVWNEFDVWSPMLCPVSDLVPSRFGIVDFNTGLTLSAESSLE